MTDKEKLLEKTMKITRSVLLPNREGLLSDAFEKEFRGQFGFPFPDERLGYVSAMELIEYMYHQDVVSVDRLPSDKRVMWGPNYMSSGSAGPGVSIAADYTLSRSTSVCARFLHNNCPHTALVCPCTHNKDDAALCQAWKRGLCFHNQCLGRHYYLEKDRAPPRLEPLREKTSNIAFSSPLVVKLKTLTEKHRREEVDLETGRRRSWVETQNKELIDITGEASPVAPPKRAVTEKVDENGELKQKKVADEEAQKKK